jgi:IS605 OrfB family transposase
VIGVDINADHLAVVETDASANPLRHARVALNTYGKSQGQAKALMGDAAKSIVAWAIESQKPIVIEKLSFVKKKNELRESGNARYARMLSSFSYNGIAQSIQSRAARHGVEVVEVNPAYTSIIGRTKFSKRYGLSTHESAALCIGRRFLGSSERLPRHLSEIADGKGRYVGVHLPVRNRGTHVWSLWRQVQKKLSAVLAAQFRARKKNDPMSRKNPARCDAEKALDFVGEIPARESTAMLLGCRI